MLMVNQQGSTSVLKQAVIVDEKSGFDRREDKAIVLNDIGLQWATTGWAKICFGSNYWLAQHRGREVVVWCNVLESATREIALTTAGGLRQIPGLTETFGNAPLSQMKMHLIIAQLSKIQWTWLPCCSMLIVSTILHGQHFCRTLILLFSMQRLTMGRTTMMPELSIELASFVMQYADFFFCPRWPCSIA